MHNLQYSTANPSLSSRVNVTSITATFISLSWSVPSGSVVTSYEVMWRALSSGDEASDDGGSGTSGSITSTSYTIQELESNTVCSVTVAVTNAAGSTITHPITIPRMIIIIYVSNLHSMLNIHTYYSGLTVTQPESQTDITAAVTGGVVSLVTVVVVLIVAVTVIVILKNCM